MPVLRKTLNLTLSGNTLFPVNESGQPDHDAGVQGENGAVALRFALPADWQDLSVNLYATAQDGAFDVASDADGAVTLELPGVLLAAPGRLFVHAEGTDGVNTRKTEDCVFRIHPGAQGVRPVSA